MAAPLLLTTTVATVCFLAYLIRRGLADGDVPGDATVRISELVPGWHPIDGWVEVEVDNPGADTALVGLALRRRAPWPQWARGPVARRTLGPRFRVDLGRTQALGAVPAGDSQRFALTLGHAARAERTQLVALVGLPGRLRLHRIDLQRGGDSAAHTDLVHDPCAAPNPSW